MSADWLRAPQEDGAVVARPELDQVGGLLAENRQLFASAACAIAGRSLADLRLQARQEAIAAAQDYFRQAGEPLPDLLGGGLILAGHQPELFHPGVWVKNFALQGLARKHGLTPINLVVDNDTVKSTAIRVPQKNHSIHVGSVAFDRTAGETPYEEREVGDDALFSTFPERVKLALRPWEYSPMLPRLWEAVGMVSRRTRLLGERLAAGRRAVERAWGCHNLELPTSRLRTDVYGLFESHILSNLAKFHQVYNAALADYRRAHRIRSRNHPVPELSRDGAWLEAPFWVWSEGAGRRGRLFVQRLHNGKVQLKSVPVMKAAQPFRTRPRALTLTLFARLFLADLFIHGIGGGKYDLLTDEIIRRFYRIEPPRFLVLSATLHLPLPAYSATAEECRRLKREHRDLHWNPQRHLADRSLRPLVEEKQRWIEFQPTNAQERREQYQQIRRVSEQLRQHATAGMEELRGRLEACEREVAANGVLRRRDYAFCLFPEEKVRGFMTRFLDL